MSTRLDDLSPDFKPYAVELLARLTEAGIPVMIIDTLRTDAEHEANLESGASSIKKSKHLVGDAIDICPWDQYQLHGPDKLEWDAEDPVWDKIGPIGEALGLRWGGRWRKPHDPGHFELVRDERGRPRFYPPPYTGPRLAVKKA